MKQTRRQRSIENKRRHRALRRLSVVTYDDLIRMHDRNPRVAFRARGKRVSFWARQRRRGPVPRHLRPYLFKRGR